MQSSSGDGSQLTQAECDAVAAAVIAQYNSLPRNGKPAQGEWTPRCSKKRTEAGGVTDMHTVTWDRAAASSADVGSITPN